MKSSSGQDSSFEYQPVQTEMYSEVSHSTINNNNHNQLSDIPSEMENVLDDSESVQNSNLNINPEINLNTLQSLRISHSIASPKDDGTTLLERMQLIRETARKNEDSQLLKTPPKKENINYDGYHNNNKVQIMKDVFDCSSTENKNVIVSELDIQISTNNKKEKGNYNPKQKKVGINLNEVFDRKAEILNKKIINTETNSTFKPISHRNIPPSSARIKMLNHEHKTNTSRPKKVDKSTYVTSSTQTSSNIGIIRTVKKKAICSSVKKTSSKQSFYELMVKMTSKSKDKRASSYKKSTNTNYSSNRSSSLTNKTNNSVRYHNTASTIDTNTGSKKRSFLIPSSGVKGKNPAPFITNFNYCATEHCPTSKTIQKRPISQKKSNIKITITTMNTSGVGKKIIKSSTSKNKKTNQTITVTNPNEKKKYNFNMKILQTIHSNYHKYHTTTENKSKTTNSFFNSKTKWNKTINNN